MKKITNLSAFLFSIVMFSSCAVTMPSTEPNIEFGNTIINAIYFKNERVTLSNENENLLINTISSQNWQRDLDIISKYRDKSEVLVDATSQIKSDNDFYQKGEYDFNYLIDLDEGYVIMDLTMISSTFHSINTKLDDNSLTIIRNIFNYTKPIEEKTITIKYAEEVNGVLKENEYTDQYTFAYNYPISHKITKSEYDTMCHDVGMSLPNNQGGYYFFEGFYSDLNKSKNNELKEGFVVDNNYTFYYTFTGGNATPPISTGQFKLTIIDENNILIDMPTQGYVTPYTELVFRTYALCDADVCMYVDNELYSKNGSNVGNYLEFKFVMPIKDVVIEFKIETMKYDYLNNYYPFIDSLDETNVNKVKLENSPIGVGPGSLKEITYTSDKTDIKELIRMLNSPLNELSPESMIDGGSYKEFTFYSGDNEYSFRFNNEIITINGKYYYLVNETYVDIQNPDLICNSFLNYNESLKIYYNNEYVTEINYLDKIEFKKFEGVIDTYFSGYTAETSFGKFYIHSPKIFSYTPQDTNVCEYYEIVGEKDFFFLNF